MAGPRVVVLVLDSVGIGAMPDAGEWGDAGSDTIGHAAAANGGINLPNLAGLGLGHYAAGVARVGKPSGGYGRIATQSRGKETVTGHWELMGCPVLEGFTTFPDGFPPEILRAFDSATGRAALGNVAASGTEIIERLGREHLSTGRPIVYTSADSVFQVAAHEDVVPLATLYAWCEEAFRIVRPHRMARVIARPFVGEPGAFVRTYNRKDFAAEPSGRTVVDAVRDVGLPTIGIGKVPSIFAGRGFTEAIKAGSNDDVVAATLAVLDRQDQGLVFANLVDFDAKYGHRRDPLGYAAALEAFDAQVPSLLKRMGEDDLLFITADHGCDPTWKGSDHTREYVPLLMWMGYDMNFGTRESLADVGSTVAMWLEAKWDGPGETIV